MITGNLKHLRGQYDVVIIGGGPAGMAAAIGARDSGAEHVLLVDREKEAGGILLQCIHPGFGLHTFSEELTGPEYAQRFFQQVCDRGIDVVADTFVANIETGNRIHLMSGSDGVRVVSSRAVVLAMGARERTRGAIRIPGTRPSGVMTAGLAQRFVNVLGFLPGRRVAILGSGNIGLIMARRLTLEGIEVVGVFEIMPFPNGLNSNIVQCLHDFDIPLHLSTTVVEIHGHDRVEKVTVAPVDNNLKPDLTSAEDVACDTLVLSVGLIPENELSRRLNLRLDHSTGGPVVTSGMETSMDGVFACGNVVHIHDLVDFATEESLIAGRSAAEFATDRMKPKDNIQLIPGENIVSCVPHSISTDREHTLYLRVKRPLDKSRLCLGEVYEKKLRYVVPAETVTVTVRPRFFEDFHANSLRIDIQPREAG